MTREEIISLVEERIQTVYDPEFPIVDIFTLGLIYEINPDLDAKKISILMTFTTPNCPAGDLLQELTIQAINEYLPEYTVEITITFEPMRNLDKIKDPDLKRMFE